MDNIKQLLRILDIALPFPILLGSCVMVFGSDSTFFSGFTYFLSFIHHASRLVRYLMQRDIGDSIFNRILCNKDFHLAIFMCITWYINYYFFLNYLRIAILNFILLIEIIYNVLSESCGSLKGNVQSLTKPLLNNVYIYRFNAIVDVVILPYLITKAIVSFKGNYYFVMFIYLVGYIFLSLLIDVYQQWVWAYLHNVIDKIARQYHDTFGKHVLAALEQFCKIPNYAKMIYKPSVFKVH